MCKLKKYQGMSNPRIDKCMRIFIENLNYIKDGDYKILACCCGHGKYRMSIVVEQMYNNIDGNLIFDLVSGVHIPRTRKFYKRDKQGFYYIPEKLTQLGVK